MANKYLIMWNDNVGGGHLAAEQFSCEIGEIHYKQVKDRGAKSAFDVTQESLR